MLYFKLYSFQVFQIVQLGQVLVDAHHSEILIIFTMNNPEKPTVLEISRPFLSPSELSYLHSLTIADDKKILYNQRKHQIFQYLFQIVKVLRFPIRVLNTAMIYYQKYYLFNEFNDLSEDFTDLERNMENDPYSIALTCLFLSSKNEDCIKKLRDIQVVANKLRDLADDNNYLDLQRKVLLIIEFKLLQILKYNFNNSSLILPSLDNLVIQFAKIKGLSYQETFFTWIMCFDLMSTPINLMLPAHCIALGIIIVATHLDTNELPTNLNDMPVPPIPEHNGSTTRKPIKTTDFKCPELLVNEAIVYILDYYVHQYGFSVLREYLPVMNQTLGKEQIFQFMNLKSKFNHLKLINENSCSKHFLPKDSYLNKWEYSIGVKGSARFMLSNKRRRFNNELNNIQSK